MSKSVAEMPSIKTGGSAGGAAIQAASVAVKNHKDNSEVARIVAQGGEAPFFLPLASALYRQITASCEETSRDAYLLKVAAGIDLAHKLMIGNESIEMIRKNIALGSIQLSSDIKKIVRTKL